MISDLLLGAHFQDKACLRLHMIAIVQQIFRLLPGKQGIKSDAVQIFRARAKHTLLLADRARHGWSATTACRLCGEQEESIAHVLTECRELADVRPGGWPTVPLNEILWCGNRVAMTTAATIMRKFLRRAMR
ncbi:hypothetical protein PoB_006754100 [Plakobranchus ocellatus]|uniref:Reverse transcriptase zinc-binding domain-containing protein n=1 Tax=Plakobranchus ocellatus TaxID=259542 RepID=A0AAV4DA38_9GAST|nr:hypothetical protein PoB_006754100 [Plakobranchus ocellatus]